MHWPTAATILSAVFLLVSGCTAPPPGSEPPLSEGGPVADVDGNDGAGSNDGAGPNATLRHFSANYTLQLTGAHAPGLNMSNGLQTNCLRIEEGVLIRAGNATATWQSQSPSADELAIAFELGKEDRVQQGGSPLTLDLAGAETVDVFDGGSFLAVEHRRDLPSAAAQQAVTLHLEFDYVGPGEFAVDQGWDCQIG